MTTHGEYRPYGNDGKLTSIRNPGFRQLCLLCLCGLLIAGCSVNTAKKQGHAVHRAVIGGLTDVPVGNVIAQYMDGQAKELAKIAETQRIDDGIIVTLNNNLLFDFNSAQLKTGSRKALRKLAEIFKKYDKTNLTVAGYTDNLGPSDYKIHISERRAKAVADSLIGLGIASERIRIIGFGFEAPMTSNDTEESREKNRRIEIHVAPDEALRKDDQAKQG